MSTLYFETDQGDRFREPGFSKERRLEPRITIARQHGCGASVRVCPQFEFPWGEL